MGRFIVTGGGGFIGRTLIRTLGKQGHEAIVAGRRLSRDLGSDWVEYDLHRSETIANLIALEPDGLFHLAWSTVPASAENSPSSDISTNVAGSVDLFRALSDARVRTVFLSSGGTVYGVTDTHPISEDHPTRPISTYGMSKLAVEQYAEFFRRSYGFDIRIARLSNPYGMIVSEANAQGAMSIFAQRIVSNDEIVIMGDGSVVRDYIAVQDAADALYLMMVADLGGSSSEIKFNIGSGIGLSLIGVISLIEKVSGCRGQIRRVAERRFDVPYNVLDTTRFRETFQWSPKIEIGRGLEELVQSIKYSKKR